MKCREVVTTVEARASLDPTEGACVVVYSSLPRATLRSHEHAERQTDT